MKNPFDIWAMVGNINIRISSDCSQSELCSGLPTYKLPPVRFVLTQLSGGGFLYPIRFESRRTLAGFSTGEYVSTLSHNKHAIGRLWTPEMHEMGHALSFDAGDRMCRA